MDVTGAAHFHKNWIDSLSLYTGNTVQLVPGKLIGYRIWLISLDGLLYPISYNNMNARTWSTNIAEAKCTKPSIAKRPPQLPQHAAPNQHCTCGLYATFDVGHLKTLVPPSYTRVVWVAGAIEAWGRIQVGSHGFRAQHARVLAVCVDAAIKEPASCYCLIACEGLRSFCCYDVEHSMEKERSMSAVRDRYDVPVFDKWEDLTKQHPVRHIEGLPEVNGDLTREPSYRPVGGFRHRH